MKFAYKMRDKLPGGLQRAGRVLTLNTRVDNAIKTLEGVSANVKSLREQAKNLRAHLHKQDARQREIAASQKETSKDLRDLESLTNSLREALTYKTWELAELRNEIEDGPPIPPGEKIFLVAGTEDANWFLKSGKSSAGVIREILANNGLAIEDFDSILDFGCGIGRIMRHWNKLDNVELHGTDYNPDLLSWCRDNLKFAKFGVNGLQSKLDYEDGKFDFIYAWSVFTHLTEPQHFHWIAELSRLLRPGGYLFFTTNGESYLRNYGEIYRSYLLETNQEVHLENLNKVYGEDYLRNFSPLSQEQKERFESGELVVLVEDASGTNDCNTFHTDQFVRETLAGDLTVVDFIPGRADIASYQDAYLLRKP